MNPGDVMHAEWVQHGQSTTIRDTNFDERDLLKLMSAKGSFVVGGNTGAASSSSAAPLALSASASLAQTQNFLDIASNERAALALTIKNRVTVTDPSSGVQTDKVQDGAEYRFQDADSHVVSTVR